MVTILYTFERPFMRKTYEAIDQHVGAESAYLPLIPESSGACDSIPAVEPDGYGVEAVDDAVREADPDVVVRNQQYRCGEYDFDDDYQVVYVRHGASVGRGEAEARASPMMRDAVDVALAPGEYWASAYREGFPDDVDVSVVGLPEADDLVGADRPRERRVLYAPTNRKYGGGSFMETAEAILELFADTDYELVFRPHPVDRVEEPTRSLVERCRDRISTLPNVTFDERTTPRPALREADVLVSDYSGIVAEWLHADRPLVQLTDIAAETNEVPEIGHVTPVADLDLGTVDRLYEHGYTTAVARRLGDALDGLGIPIDGRASERAARELEACTR